MKAARACPQCRESKRKCIRPGPGEPCAACHQRKLKCGGRLQLPSAAAISRKEEEKEKERKAHRDCRDTTISPSVPWETIVELVEIYLDKLHDRPHSIFHPATLRAQLRDRSLCGTLLYSICAVASKFSSDVDRHGLEMTMAAEAKRRLKADLENVCIENIQACILLSTLSAGNCDTSSAALFTRIAMSMAEIMHLHSSAMDGTAIARETARRIWWSLYMADRWCFSALGLPRHMDGLGESTDLPLEELAFRSLSPNQSTLEAPRNPGLWAHMVSLVRLFGPIQDSNRRAATNGHNATDTAELDQVVEQLTQQLDDWEAQLAAGVHFTIQNLQDHQHNNLGGLFIALHLAYHYYSSLLYFRFLETRNHTPSSIYNAYAARCKHHASSFSSLLQLSRQLEGCEALYPTVGHMTTVSSAVLLHTMLFGDEDEIPSARRELSANFAALMELQQYWPATTAMINRLMMFQNTCLVSTESHRLDGWMVRFLLEHSLALQKRELALPVVPAGDQLDAENISAKAKECMEKGRYTAFESL